MKVRYMHTRPGAMTLDLDLAVGDVHVLTEDREHAEITLEAAPGDEIAEDLISRTEHPSRGDTLRVSIPRPDRTTLVQFGGSGVQMVSGNSVCVSGGNITMNNGRVVTSGGVQQVASGGAVRVLARLPKNSEVKVTTTSANLTTQTGLRAVRFHSVSGEARIDSADSVRASTASGDLRIGEVAHLDVRSVSGDIRTSRLTGSDADLESISGDLNVHVVHDAHIIARTVSGDIRISTDPRVRVRTSANSVSGRVRTPQQ